MPSLVGSEMCIRDRIEAVSILQKAQIRRAVHPFSTEKSPQQSRRSKLKEGHPMNQMGSPVPCLNQRLTRIRDYLIKITSGFFKAPVVMPSPLSLNRGPEYPTSSRIGRVPRLRKIQYSRLGVSRGPYYPLSDGTRESVGYAEDSHHRTDQLAHRARLPHFHANRSSIDLAEYSNQRGRVPVQYGEISKAVQTQLGPTQQNGRDPPQHSQLEHRRHSAELWRLCSNCEC